MASVAWERRKKQDANHDFEDTIPITPNFTGDELKQISTSDQLLIAQNASKKQYFMNCTNCADPSTVHKFLSEAAWDAEVAVINYVHYLKENEIEPPSIKIPEMYRLTTEEQMQLFSNMDSEQKHASVENAAAFVSHMNFADADALRLNDKIDHRDSSGLYRRAQIIEKWGTNLRLQYLDNSDNKSTWSDYGQQPQRFAAFESITKRTVHRFNDLKAGDYIDICPALQHKEWCFGEIIAFDTHSNQTKVKYNHNNKDYEYWVHMDNEKEVALATSKTFAAMAAMDTPQGNDDEHKDIDIKRNPLDINVNQWKRRDIVQWISDLENGRYAKYVHVLLNSFNKQEINGSDLSDLSEKDLFNLGIIHFGDRKSLYKHIVILCKSMKERFKSNELNESKRDLTMDDDEPEEFCCPISYEIMKDPVILSVSGQTYERKAIEEYIKSEHQDPITLQKAQLKHIVPNRILKIVIQKWQQK